MAAAVPYILANTIQGAIIRFALSLAVTMLTQKLFGDEPNLGDQKDPGTKQRIPADPSNKLPVVYGNERIYGSIVYADITDDNQTLAFIIALCEGPIHNINDVYWDDYKLSLRDNGWVHNATHSDGTTDNWLNDRLKIVKYPDGGRCAEMEAFSPKWATNAENRQMPDVAYAYVELKYDRDRQISGLTGKLGFNIEGKLIRTIDSNLNLLGPEPRPIPLRDQINLDIFDKNLLFTDFNGRQIFGYFSGGSININYSIGKGHQKVIPGGTYQIIDMGLDPQTGQPASINDYLNNGTTYGAGAGAMVKFHFVEPGEHHTGNHYANNLFFQYFTPQSYTNPVTGVTVADDGYRYINALEITDWGSNYSASFSDHVTVWLVYTFTDLAGTVHKRTYPLRTGHFNAPNLSTEYEKAQSLLSSFAQPFGSDPYNYGYRKKIDPLTRPTDSVGNVYEGVYLEHQQFFTAKVPYLLGESAKGYYSVNPAECLLDYLTNQIYGCGLSITENDLDLQTFYDHKVFCDDLISYIDEDGNSAQSKRYECNGFINTGDEKDLNISDIVNNSQSIFSYTLGKFQMISDTTGNSVKTFDDTNIYGEVTMVNDGFNSQLNELTLKYKARSQEYQDDQVFFDYEDKYFNEPILSKDMRLKFIGTNVEAERLGTVMLNKSRSTNLISFKTDTNAFNLQVNDVITVKDTYYNLNTKRLLYANLYNTNNNGLVNNNVIGQLRFLDQTEGKYVKYKDGTDAIISFPYNASTHEQLLPFFKECINGQYVDTTFTLTKEQERQNNKLGEIINLVTNNEDYTTGDTYGGGFIFHLNDYSLVHKNTSFNDVRFNNITSIYGTSWILGVENHGTRDGSQFKINSISETELEGGLQGYYITAQEYNPDDYVVATLTAKPSAPAINSTRGYLTLATVSNLTLNNTYPSASIPYIDMSFDVPNVGNIEGIEISYSDTVNGNKILLGAFNSPTGSYTPLSTNQLNVYGIPTTADLYIWIRAYNNYARGDYSSGLSVGAWNPANASNNIGAGSVTTSSIQTGAVTSTSLANTLDLTGKTVILPADAVKAHTGEWDSTTKTADFTITNTAYWQGYFVDTTSNTVTLTLPASPDTGDIIKIIDVGANASTNNIILDGNGNNIQGVSSNYNISTNRSGTEFIFLSGQGWVLTNVH
jgi:hypothetical protein